jgi:hypothetical protein
MGPLVAVDILMTRTGAGMVVGASGNISPDVAVASGLPVAFRPADLARVFSGRRLVQAAWVSFDNAGNINLTDGLPGQTYVAAADYFVSGLFHRGF